MDIPIKSNNRYKRIFIILTLISFIMLTTTILLNGAVKRYYTDKYSKDILSLPVDIYFDETLVIENLTQISKIDINNVNTLKLKTTIPTDIASYFDCLFLKTICGSTKVYLDNELIFSFPKKGGYFDVNTRSSFLIRNSELKGKELSVVLNTKDILLKKVLNTF